MKLDDQLRHAADEMDRVTASLAPPEIGELRRSVQMRTVSVAIAAAVGVAVLVGGAVLLLRPPGETTLAPAGPGETVVAEQPSSTTIAPEVPSEVAGVAIRVPELDAEPEWRVYTEAGEIPFEIPAAVAQEIDRVLTHLASDLESQVDEVLVLGSSGGYRSYLATGQFRARSPEASSGNFYTACIVSLSDGATRQSCFADGGADLVQLVEIDESNGPAAFGVVGRSIGDSSVVVLDIDGSKVWARTREGTVNAVAYGSIESHVEYTIYDSARNPLDSGLIWNEERAENLSRAEATDTTTAVAVPDGASCSGGTFFPETYPRADLPEPVVQTIGRITLFASRCWYDELADAAADFFTASFGGMEPAELWAFEEAEGYEPMYHLLKVLDMPHSTTEVDGRTLYIWPAAAAHDGDWDSIPPEDKESLRTLYDEADFADFAQFGAYIGYRIGIFADGDWSFFVVGD